VKLRILIADDSDMVRRRLVDMLEEIEGVEIVGQACQGCQAIAMIRELKPDMVILDIRMPERNGIEVLHDIGKETSRPVVIMLTNYPYEQYQRTCTEAGSDYFFDKSSEFDKVPELCRQLIESSLPNDNLIQ